ncbi:hypothetical protein BaRGS_00011777 [Batillaria attramentaria]|uniref:Uncharacterized protein n=1 Tax=Batillaria attramentaria TaxID=370345 RepID=A0ABD0LD25_9CAEN
MMCVPPTGVLLYVLTKRTLDECQQTAAEMPEVTTTSEKTDRGHTTAAPPDDVGGACTCDDRLVEFTIPAIILDLICLVIPYFILTGCVESEEKSKIAEDNPDHIGESNPDFPAVDPDFAEINLDFAENDTPRNTLPR